MLRYSLIFGGIIGVLVIALMSVTLFVLGPEGGGTSELVGYATMIVVMSLIFIGIKRYRDVEHGGVIKFKQGATVGAGIAVIAGIFYVISWEFVLAMTDFAFIETYSQSLINAAKADDLSASEEAARLAEIEDAKELYRNPLFRLPITFVEVFPVGLVIALISAAILKNSKVLPARTASQA